MGQSEKANTENRISAEQRMLLRCIANSVFDKEIEDGCEFDAAKLYDEAKSQGVVGNVFSALDSCKIKINGEVYKKFFRSSVSISVNNAALSQVQAKAVSVLSQNDIGYAVLKGMGISMLYKDPTLRMTSDTDILVSERDHDKAEKCFENAGFLKGEHENNVHSEFFIDNKIIELHKKLNGLPSGKLGEKIISEFSEIDRITQTAELEGHSFNIPKPEYMAIVLLLHAYEHLCEGGLGVRHILDHAVFAEKYLTDGSEYAQGVINKIKEYKMYDFACVITKTAVKMFELDESRYSKLGVTAVDDKICDELIFDIFDGGLYGRKKENERYLSGLIVKDEDKNSSAIVRFFKHYVAASERVIPACKKFFPLYLVAFVYLPIRFIFRVLTGKRRKVNFTQTYKMSVKRHELYSKFNMFEK